MKVVSNSTPLIGLASIQRFDLLQRLFGEIYIAQGVYDEVVVAGHEHGGAKREASAAQWIKRRQVEDRLAVEVLLDDLDVGEAETIVLARELGADLVLMDEKKGRRKLAQLGMPRLGTIGILVRAKDAGLLPAIRPELARLRDLGFTVSQVVVDIVLKQVGE